MTGRQYASTFTVAISCIVCAMAPMMKTTTTLLNGKSIILAMMLTSAIIRGRSGGSRCSVTVLAGLPSATARWVFNIELQKKKMFAVGQCTETGGVAVVKLETIGLSPVNWSPLMITPPPPPAGYLLTDLLLRYNSSSSCSPVNCWLNPERGWEQNKIRPLPTNQQTDPQHKHKWYISKLQLCVWSLLSGVL